MSPISQILYLLLPMVFAGVSNMIFMKLPVLGMLKIPMDRGCTLRDGMRLFGNNKTWKGFLGMIGLTSLWLGVFGALARHFEWARALSLFPFLEMNNFFWGAVWGLAYVLAELPNSFIKRRINIAPGKGGEGIVGRVFYVFDQADSVIGCAFAMLLFYAPSLIDFVAIVVAGTLIHLLVNLLLYLVGLKKQAG